MEVMLLGCAAGLKGFCAPQAHDIPPKASEGAAVTAALGQVAVTIAVYVLQRLFVRKRLSVRINLEHLLTVARPSSQRAPSAHAHRRCSAAGLASPRAIAVAHRAADRGGETTLHNRLASAQDRPKNPRRRHLGSEYQCPAISRLSIARS